MTKQATARKERNVVPFPGKGSSGNKAVREKRGDTALIRECVIFAQSLGAYAVGFKADPDGDNKHAASLGSFHLDRARQALTKLLRTRATTAEGLQAKARIVPMMLDNSAGDLDEDDEAFLLSFAADVKAFLKPTIDEHWRADLAAKRGAVVS
jgi:hypothetical protein